MCIDVLQQAEEHFEIFNTHAPSLSSILGGDKMSVNFTLYTVRMPFLLEADRPALSLTDHQRPVH